MPLVLEVPVPEGSDIFSALRVVHFSDAYQTVLTIPGLSPADAYKAIFGITPHWIRALMRVRGVIASALKLKHEASGDFPSTKAGCQVGQRIGIFTVQSVEANELIVGDNDKHLDFRISIYMSSANGVETVTVSTAVEIHNAVGKLYMLVVKPFHRLIARSMVQRAVNVGRL